MRTFWIVLIVVLLAAAGFSLWYFFMKKNPEGGMCRSDSKCQLELKCLSNKCSSGTLGSSCGQKSDCTPGLICKKLMCTAAPDYSKYFSSIVIGKIKPGSAPGPDNPVTVTNTMSTTDSIEIDLTGIKPTMTDKEIYFELVNPTTGDTVYTGQKQSLNGHETQGMGTSLSAVAPGTYDFNFYLNNEFVYTTQITVTK